MADFQDQLVRVSFPPLKFGIFAIFVLLSHLNEIFETDRIDRYNWEELLEFFSEFFAHTSLQERGFLLEKRGFVTFLDLLGHGIQILTTRSIVPSRIFPPFSSPETIFKVRKT